MITPTFHSLGRFVPAVSLFVVAIFIAAGTRVHAADALKHQKTANSYALSFLKQDDHGEEAEKTYIAAHKLDASTALNEAFKTAVTVGRKIIKDDSLKPTDEPFALLLAENTDTELTAHAAGGDAGAPKEKKAEAKTDVDFMLDAAESLYRSAASKTTIYFLGHVYRHEFSPPANDGDPWRTDIAAISRLHHERSNQLDRRIAAAANTSAEAAAKVAGEGIAGIKLTEPQVEAFFSDASFRDFLVAYGRHLDKPPAASSTTAQATTEVATATHAGASTATTTTTTTTTQTTTAKDSGGKSESSEGIDPSNLTLKNTTLRRLGISLGAGVGTTFGPQGAVFETANLRFNLTQPRTTARWNDYVSLAKDGKTYRVGYGPNQVQGSALAEGQLGKNATLATLEDWLEQSVFTSYNLYVGTGLPGTKVVFGHDSKGVEIKARPYVVGYSQGLFHYKEAASLIYLDFGATVSPDSAFRYSKPYFGISADGLVILSIMDGLRSFTDPGVSTGKKD